MVTRVIEGLVRIVAGHDEAFERRPGDWGSLKGYSVRTQYPNTLPGSIRSRVFTEQRVAGALALPRPVGGFVATRVVGQG